MSGPLRPASLRYLGTQLLALSGDYVAVRNEGQAANPAQGVSGEVNIAILCADDNELR